MAAPAAETHNLSLRVMRLARPSFTVNAPVVTAFKGDFAAGGVPTASTSSAEGLGLSPFLSLPAHFGDIHQGETFSCYISVQNHSNEAVILDQIKCELQATTKKVPLVDSKDPYPFDVGTSSDYVIKYKIEEAGVHILVCVCSYTKLTGEKKWFRKFFKFQVTSPFAIKPKVLPLPHGLAVQVTVTNNSTRAIFVENVEIDQSTVPAEYRCTNISPKSTANTSVPGLPDLGNIMYMQVSDIRQFLYVFEFKELDKPDMRKVSGPVGLLRVRWKSCLGDPGELTVPITDNNLPDKRKIAILVSNLPKQFFLEEIFTINFQIQNKSDLVIRPQIVATLGGKTGVLVFGNCSAVASEVPPGTQSSPITLSFIPVRSGIQQLPRIVVHDLISNAQFDWGIPFPVFIERRDDYVASNLAVATNGAEPNGHVPSAFPAGTEPVDGSDASNVGVMGAVERSDGGGEQGEVVAKEELVLEEKQPASIIETNTVVPEVSPPTDVEAITVRPPTATTGMEAENIDLSESTTDVMTEDTEPKTPVVSNIPSTAAGEESQ